MLIQAKDIGSLPRLTGSWLTLQSVSASAMRRSKENKQNGRTSTTSSEISSCWKQKSDWLANLYLFACLMYNKYRYIQICSVRVNACNDRFLSCCGSFCFVRLSGNCDRRFVRLIEQLHSLRHILGHSLHYLQHISRLDYTTHLYAIVAKWVSSHQS